MSDNAATIEKLSLNDLIPEGAHRMRRLRATPQLRAMVQETHLRVDKLIYPFFVIEGKKSKKAN